MNPLDISQNIYCRYENTRMVRTYTGLLALYGLVQTAVTSKSKRLLDKCVKELEMYPGGFPHPKYNFECYVPGGNALAYLLYEDMIGSIELDSNFRERGRALLREYSDKTLAAPADSEGILCMPGCKVNNMIWIDIVTAVTPFMMFSSMIFGNSDYMDFAAEQCFKMIDVFRDDENDLLHQSRGFMNDPMALSEDHWSRGNAWAYLGLRELVEFLPKDSKYRNRAENEFIRLSEAIIKFQGADGMWRQEMTVDSCWSESSGSAIFLYGLGSGLRLGLLPEKKFLKPYERGINELFGSYVGGDFETKSSCPGCLCAGEGKNKGSIEAYINEKKPQNDEPHSFGAIMLAAVEAYRFGIKNIEVGRK